MFQIVVVVVVVVFVVVVVVVPQDPQIACFKIVSSLKFRQMKFRSEIILF